MRRKLVQFGAGNIGRSFVARLFSAADYEVVLVDVDPELVALLNDKNAYSVVELAADGSRTVVTVAPVRACLATDVEAVVQEIIEAELVATSVGARAIDTVADVIARAVLARRPGGGSEVPLNVLLAENIGDGAERVRSRLKAALGENATDLPGVIETSIGKMVPIVTAARRAEDPLAVYAEPYNTLIADAEGWRGAPPQIEGLSLVSPISAYVERKLYIHNLGHAALAYFGYRTQPDKRFISDVVRIPEIRERAEAAMRVSVAALTSTYADVFTREALDAHVDDLIARFANPYLGDTVHRVGRDLSRKLSRWDRVVGGGCFAEKVAVDSGPIAEVYAAALWFRAPDESGSIFPADETFHESLKAHGTEWALTQVSSLPAAADAGKQPPEAVSPWPDAARSAEAAFAEQVRGLLR